MEVCISLETSSPSSGYFQPPSQPEPRHSPAHHQDPYVPNLWIHGGNLHHGRHYSSYLAVCAPWTGSSRQSLVAPNFSEECPERPRSSQRLGVFDDGVHNGPPNPPP